jgi:hypothetical protein
MTGTPVFAAISGLTRALQVVAQSNLASLFPDGRHTIVADSTHYIHLDQPNVVVGAITDVVEAVRADASLEK